MPIQLPSFSRVRTIADANIQHRRGVSIIRLAVRDGRISASDARTYRQILDMTLEMVTRAIRARSR